MEARKASSLGLLEDALSHNPYFRRGLRVEVQIPTNLFDIRRRRNSARSITPEPNGFW
ncbi:unnamed protein product [Penicillium camemberti]|uniref:Str. FM013 n=1 Tax=Penicillium camemberti (strain FM 013) TaxID=1429867 RepID=A0A0G4PRT6_PENC3|nr:unnamed protein product [Penicillium camemberti]